MDPTTLRARIQRGLPEAIDSILGLVTDDGEKSNVRLKAFEALADRGGLPAVKATLSQTLTGTMGTEALVERKAALLEDQQRIKAEIDSLKTAIDTAKAEPRKRLPRPEKED